MASSGIVAGLRVADICGGMVDFEIRVRVINLWTTPDRTNPQQEGAIHMVLLDEQLSTIHATVRKDLIPKFKEMIKEGCAYVMEKFMVAKNDANYRTTPHNHKLKFMRGTSVFKVHPAAEIPKNHFNFVPFQEILMKTKENEFLDVIGHVVERNAIRDSEKNGKISKLIDTTLEDLQGNKVHCTLWDHFAIEMQFFLDHHDPSKPLVIVIQLAKLSKFLGTMGVSNSFNGTKLFLGSHIPEITEYIERMHEANVELTQGVSQMSGPVLLSVGDDLLQTPKMTIEDLIESTQKCCGSVLVRACEFETDAGWFYQACTKCASRITFAGGQLYCEKCKMPRTAVPRFKVHLQVIDKTGSITFVLFDRVVSQFIGRTAQDLLDAMNNEPGNHGYPQELDVLIDKRILFKVEVTDANLYRNWRGYNVKKLTEDPDIIKQFCALYKMNFGSEDNDTNIDHSTSLPHNNDPRDIIEVGDSSTNDYVVVVDPNTTPTSKPTSKRPDDADGVGSSAKRELLLIDVDSASVKQVGKRSADDEVVEVADAKETKMACVVIEETN